MNIPESRFSRRSLLHAAGAAAVATTAISLAAPTRAAAATSSATANALATYPVPDGVTQHDTFAIKVRTPGGTWQPVSCYQAETMMIDATTGSGQIFNSSMAYFDFTGTVDVSITYTKDAIKKVQVRPLSYNIPFKVNHRTGTITFTLTEPRNLAIDVNGDIFDNLQLFAGTIDPSPPSATDPNVIYYGPGVHSPTGGTLTVPSGKTVYLAGGAVLNATVQFSNVQDVKLLGRGVIYTGSSGGGCLAEYSSNVVIDGITMLNPNGYAVTCGQAQNVTITNMRSISAKGWGDGIDLFCCQDVLIDGVFMRNSDDCVAIYNHRWNYYGDSTGITVQNSSLWADVAHPVNVGTHGNTASNETIENLTISNIDILDHREPQMDYQGCIALNPGDGNLIRNVRIEDVRVEDFRLGQLVNMRVMYNTLYNTSPGRGIEMVYIKNLSYNGTHSNPSIMVGYDADHLIKDITFENLVINGTLISDTDGHPSWYKTGDYVPMFDNEHVQNLTFVNPGAPLTGVLPAITSTTTGTATVGTAYSYTITASNSPYVYAATGLPAGLAVDTSTGIIAGTPTAAGTYAITVSATNAVGAGTATLTLVVS